MNKASKSGFTIVELIIVIVVIAILAAITIVTFQGVQARALDSQKAAMAKNIATALDLYFAENNRYPATGALDREAGATLIGLSLKDFHPTGYKGWSDRAIQGQYANNSNFTGFSYIAHPSPTGSGFTCADTTVCRHYTLGYWSTAENKQITIRKGQ